MGLLGTGVWLVVILVSAYVYHELNKIPPLPSLEETWWGSGKRLENQDSGVKPFRIDIPQEIIEDLSRRLENVLPFQPPLEGVYQNYGINTNLLKKIVDYWKSTYNWTKSQEYLNKYPQFKTNIQGLDIHFLHVKPQKTDGIKVLPLMLLHGWPGSIREFYEMIPILTTPHKVIIPSLPGYGFSEATSKPGLGINEMAVIMKNLMAKLGFERYYLQGGDWGSFITGSMAVLYPEHVIGVHHNMCPVQTPKSTLKLVLGSFIPSLMFTEKEAEMNLPLKKQFGDLLLEMGYLHLQATKPDTLGVALRDSPVGLAAYILEKFTIFTNLGWKNREDGGLTEKFTLDQLLDNVMIYWVTRSFTTSVRLYAEGFSARQISSKIDYIPITIPSACARFEHELVYTPESILRDKYKNLVHLSNFEDGGHFAALELPQILAQDVFEFVDKVENLPKSDLVI